jgi:hypothetical protein
MSADATAHLALAFLAESQQHKEVTFNEALNRLDATVQLAVIDRDLAAPPTSPTEGDRYLVAAGGVGAWSGADGAIAAFFDGAWTVLAPAAGWVCWVADEKTLLVHDGTAWRDFGAAVGALQNLMRLGIGTAADATNPFAAKLNNALWTAMTSGEGGSGDLRYVFNKETTANTGSLLFQTGFAGHAEVGLAGDDDLHFKVSPDGTAWYDALVLDRASGTSRVKRLADATTAKPIASLLLTPGGDGEVSIWRNDTLRAAAPRTATIASVSGDTITLTTASAGLFFQNTQMAGVSYLRIWNVSKAAPGAPAWVKYVPAANQLQVIDAAAIAGWAAGETVQIGDPAPAVVPTPAFALDISQMLQSQLGAIFRQSAIIAKAGAIGSGISVGISASGTAASGSFNGVVAMSDGSANSGLLLVPTPTQSPISNSNLVFLREDDGGAADISLALMSVLGVYT